MNELQIKLKTFQDKFVFSSKRYPAFIAGVGTGKTLCALLKILILCEQNPNNLALVVRREFTDLRDSTMKDFERYTNYKIDSDKEVHLPNGSIIMFRHGAEVNVLKNINLGAFFLEQAEEFETDEQFTFLRDRLRRGNVAVRCGMITGNAAGHNWIWKLWKADRPSDEYELVEATTFDNADNLPTDFIKDLKNMEKESPHHFARYVMNSWEDFEKFDTLIPYDWIKKCVNKGFVAVGGRILACDVGHFGDSETAIKILQRVDEARWKETYSFAWVGQDTMKTTGKIVSLKKEFKFAEQDYIVIDDDGLGKGVSDRLNELGIKIAKFHANEKAINDSFTNKRAETWWRARELIRQGLLDLQNDEKTIAQLSILEYDYTSAGGKKYIRSKEGMRKKGLPSPDRADALMMACSLIELVPPPEKPKTQAQQFWDRVNKDLDKIYAEEKEEVVI